MQSHEPDHRRIVFLSIDGVLNCDQHFIEVHRPAGLVELSDWATTQISEDLVRHLNVIVAETGASIVVWGPWSCLLDLPTLQSVLHAKGLQGALVDTIGAPMLDQEHVNRWLGEQANQTSYVVLGSSEDAHMMLAVIDKSIWIEPSDGLRPVHVRMAISKLKDQIRAWW